jgi:rod shape-determining protein MreC
VPASRPRRRAVAGAVVLALVITVLVASGGVFSGLKAGGRVITAPFAWVLDEIAHPIADVVGGVLNYSSVVAQNRQLREELALQSEQANEDSTLQNQIAQISATEHLPYVGGLSAVVAEVTVNSPTNFSATFTINKGRDSGVLSGMPVVGGGGLIGRVVATSDTSATVLLITDPTSIVGATFGRGRIDLLLSGHGVNNDLGVSNVAVSAPLAPGTLFVTNSLRGGIFPPGIPVARVQSVTYTPGSFTYNMSFTPTADLHNLYYVDVLQWEPST